MSFQPFERTWYDWIPRTIAADWLGEVGTPPAVWWTTAKASRDAYEGLPRTMLSFAFHPARVMIAGLRRARNRAADAAWPR